MNHKLDELKVARKVFKSIMCGSAVTQARRMEHRGEVGLYPGNNDSVAISGRIVASGWFVYWCGLVLRFFDDKIWRAEEEAKAKRAKQRKKRRKK